MAKRRKSLGYGFPDEVAKVTAKVGHFKKEEPAGWTDFLLPNFRPGQDQIPQKSKWRIMVFLIISLVLFFIIFLRLFHLQIARGSINKELADNNRIRVKIIHAPRGVIFDRDGRILAANSPAFRLNSKLITREEALEWEVKNDPRALDLEVDNLRIYPEGEKFAHVAGFTGEISEDQLKTKEFRDYRQGDQIGKIGAEAKFEKLLRGVDGGEIIEVDSIGRKIRTLRFKSPIPGQNIYLSIDASLQEKLYQSMTAVLASSGSCCGAAVALDPGSGKILALVSLPSFDPNIFSQGIDEGAISEILSRSSAPILNRAIAGTYPPGSTFKIVSSLAALSSSKITKDTTIQDTGVIYLGPYKFTNWYFNQYGKTEGMVNLVKALERSNDTYFYEISRIIGVDSIADWARKLHLGGKLNIDLPGEETGLVPDDDWKKKVYGQPWYPGDTLHMAIGQGFILTTPLQILGITSFIAADGTLYKPEILLSESPKILVSNLLPKDQVRIIKEGMKLGTKQKGTAWPFFNFPVETAGKTGTAEYGDPKNRTHAWYTSFAPADDPKIALTILVEGGGEGSSVAAPVAKEVYRYFFSPDKNKLIQDVSGEAASSAYIPAVESARTLGE